LRGLGIWIGRVQGESLIDGILAPIGGSKLPPCGWLAAALRQAEIAYISVDLAQGPWSLSHGPNSKIEALRKVALGVIRAYWRLLNVECAAPQRDER
jgi:hypothetical protein